MKKRILSLSLSLSILLSTTSVFANGLDLEYIDKVTSLIKDSYLYQVEDQDLTEGALKGIFKTLDPYSNYYTKAEYQKLTQSLNGQIEHAGIGIEISDISGVVKIKEVIKNNQAEKAGLKIEDIIISVDDIEVAELPIDNITELIKGKAGSTVKIGIVRENEEEPLYFNIVREPIVITPVEYRELETGIGYIKINEFNNNALIGVKTAIRQFDAKNIKKIVFDVRNNPGGYLSTVSEMLQPLVPRGPIFHTVDSKGRKTTEYSYNRNPKYKIAVLTNENSASASEIFAGAIKERGVGIVVGSQTFGKGTVQSIMETPTGGAIKLTIAEYFTPKMNRVNEVGITPDIIINDVYNKEETDLVLQRAVEELRNN